MDELITQDGTNIDLTEGIPIPLNLSIADFREPDKRQRNFSKEIDVPGTANNLKYFASAFSLSRVGGAFDFNSSAKVNCTYYKKGIAVLPNAVIKLNRVIILDGVVTFKLGLFADFVDIFLLLSTKSIKELDWSEYNHELTVLNVENSWTEPAGTGYYYPLIERKQRPTAIQWRLVDMIPYVYMVEVFKKCMQEVDQEFTSDFMESDLAKNILFGYGGGIYVDRAVSPTEIDNRKVLANDGDISVTKSNVIPDSPVATIPFAASLLSVEDPVTGLIPFNLTEIQDIYSQLVPTIFTAQNTGQYKLNLTGQLRVQYTGDFDFTSSDPLPFMILKDNIIVYTTNLLRTSADQTFAIDISINLQISSGQEISFFLGYTRVTITDGLPGSTIEQVITTTVPFELEINCLETTVVEGSVMEVSRFLPDMKCSDFVLGFIRLCNAMISDPDAEGKVDIEPMRDFYKPKNIYTDISSEIDELKDIEIRPSANEYAKTLKYSWKTGTETDAKDYIARWGHAYGDLSITQESFFAKGEQKIELPFATIIPYQVAPGIVIPRFVDIDSNGVKKTTEGVPRIMFRNGTKTGDWQLVASTTTSYGVYPSVHHFDDWEAPTFDLNFQLVEELFYPATSATTSNSYSEFYDQFVNEIINREGKYVQLYRKMNAQTVKNLDWSKLLMWNGTLFRFNKILDFDSEITESTKIELIKFLEKKQLNRVVINPTPGPGSFYKTIIIDPSDSVGESVPVLSGGTGDQVLATSKRIIG